MPSPNTNFDALLSTTFNNHAKNIVDNVFDEIPLLVWLRNKKRQEGKDGGAKIVMPILYDKNTTFKSYAGYEPIDTTPQDDLTAAEFEWKQAGGSVSISGIEEDKNNGVNQITSLLKSKIETLEGSMMDGLAEMIFGDGTGNSGKDLEGLKSLIANDPTTGTVGGINRATYSFWRNQTLVGTDGGTPFDNLQSKMRSVYNLCSTAKGAGKVDIMISDRLTFEGYEGSLVAQKRFASSDGDAAFENLLFKGKPVTWDTKAPATSALGNMYFINSRYLKWIYHNRKNFVPTPFLKPVNQDAKIAQLLFTGNLVISNPRACGVIYNISLT